MARRRAGGAERAWLQIAPIAAALLVFGVLRSLAASDVRDAPQYIVFYLWMGLAWIGIAVQVLGLLGIGARDDVIERGNLAAAFAIAGALLGSALCYAGGNIGDGPGWWVVIFSAFLATGGLFVLWWLLPIQVAKPSRFRALTYRALALIGLHRNSAGGFGSVIPLPAAGGSGGLGFG